MHYHKIEILKNGVECVIRSAEACDAQEVYDIFNLTHLQTDFLLAYPDENSLTAEQEENYLLTKLESSDEIEICAVINNKIVGTAGIEAIGHKYKVKHRAEFYISIDKAYWNMGIGKLLTAACIECAEIAGYSQLELQVVSGNISALRLYESMGFIEFGRNPKGFKSRISGWQEIILMRREL